MTDVAAPSGIRRGPFVGLVASFFVSEVGTAMSGVAIPWLVLVTSGSAGRTGLVGFAEMAPYVVLHATSGPVADRLGWRRTCVGGNVVAAVTVAAIPVLHALGALPFGLLLALVAVAGTARGAADAATSPLVPGAAALAAMSNERAAGLYSGANRTALLIGLPTAGVLIGATSPSTVVLIDSISFALAALGYAITVPSSVQAERPDGPLTVRGYGADLLEGLRFLRADRLLIGVATLVAVTNLFDQALTAVLLPVWVRDRLHDATGIGVIGGGLGVGALAGVLLGAWLGERLPRRLTFSVGYLLGAAPPFLALAIFADLPPVLVVAVLAGFFGGFQNPIIGAVLYERVPHRLQARVLGVVRASAWIGIPFGALLGGVLTEAVGLRAALVISGAVMFVVTLAPLVFPVWRSMDRRVASATP
jgi:MFS family permease